MLNGLFFAALILYFVATVLELGGMVFKKEKITRPVARRTGKSIVKSSLDLRGKRYEEAMMELDRYLDQVLLSSYSQVEIIHGKGTGALQKGVQQHLKQHPKVKSYRMGHPNEGGFGVTIVEMK